MFIRIEDATSLNLGDIPVVTPELYLAWQAHVVTQRRIARVWKTSAKLLAQINHGRWIIVCPECTVGVYTHPVWQIACCGECGAVYSEVEFPRSFKTIELLLLKRSRPMQNWVPGETVQDLINENREHEVRE